MTFKPNQITELCISLAETFKQDLDHMFHTIYYNDEEVDGYHMDHDEILDMIDFYREKNAGLIEKFKENLDE